MVTLWCLERAGERGYTSPFLYCMAKRAAMKNVCMKTEQNNQSYSLMKEDAELLAAISMIARTKKMVNP